MSFFGEQFYPTPSEVIELMLAPYKKDKSSYGLEYHLPEYILEPSAGKGDIIKFIEEKNSKTSHSFFAMELDPDLQEILKSMDNVEFIHNDFLNYEGDLFFDMIIMNPPFQNGDEHLLKAWNILNEGDIVCLLNSETLKNPYTQKRKQLQALIEKHGSVEHIGQCFSDAQRKANVDVSIVRLKKEADFNIFDFKFEPKGEDNLCIDDLNSESLGNELAVNDIIGSVVIQYEQLKKAYINWMKASKELDFYSKGLFSNYDDVQEFARKSGYHGRGSFNTFVKKIKHSAWKYVLSKSGIDKFMTTKVQNNFSTFINQQSQMGFTKDNIYQVIYNVISNSGTILEQAIEDAFDLMTKHYPENRLNVEGWKTNDSWKVNKKVIFDYGANYGKYLSSYDLKRYGDNFSLSYDSERILLDIDKALCYLSGKKFETCKTMAEALNEYFHELGCIRTQEKYENKVESTFFYIKFFKKGSLHLEFKDDKILEEFNIRATKMKNWLPHREYDEWKAKRNGEERINKSHRINQTTLF